MVIYKLNNIDTRWINYWNKFKIFKTNNLSKKSKIYILDMFPYPSGAGLHVGHPMGYIASDIYARFHRLKGFNILHPIGFDSFGLPTEQYAIQTGLHPESTTINNIKRYRYQMDKIGFSFDWAREINTSDPFYYKWTQWIFIQFFNSWYDLNMGKARKIDDLINIFEKEGNLLVKSINSNYIKIFTSIEWKLFDQYKKQLILHKYRLAFRKLTKVNWCPELGTVLANNEIKDGNSERGGFKVYKINKTQWSIRINAYADILIKGLQDTNWSNSLKEIQINWIGKSNGVVIKFPVINKNNKYIIKIFTNRPDTILYVNLIILYHDNPIIDKITSLHHKHKVENYLKKNNNLTAIFIGTYCLHPLIKNRKLPIYISNYIQYYSVHGAFMGVPSTNLYKINVMRKKKIINYLKLKKKVYNKTIYKLRDAIFSRQRYWGEPIPIYYKENISYPINKYPLLLPLINKYYPYKKGQSTLSRSNYWAWNENKKKIVYNNLINYRDIFTIEKNTMPGWAGSSWYFLRYMNKKNNLFFFDKKSEAYWKNVDLYIGGAEHATGHLIYSRIFHIFLKDRGWVSTSEPFRKIINQGMIIAKSALIARVQHTKCFVSAGLVKEYGYSVQKIYIDINIINNNYEVDINKLIKWRDEFINYYYLLEKNGIFLGYKEKEKMSKSKYNVINPDYICDIYGADTLRMYEMFLGPIPQSKNWNIIGIKGIKQFINKILNLFYINNKYYIKSKVLYCLKKIHYTIKKVKVDISNLALNTAISTLMITITKFKENKCNNIEILKPLIILLYPFAPFISEELWHKIGNKYTIFFYTQCIGHKYIKFRYTIGFNGKNKVKIYLSQIINKEVLIKKIINLTTTCDYLHSKIIDNIIIFKKNIINFITNNI